jgi:hypothetical protein
LLALEQMTATGRGSRVSSEVGWIVEPRGVRFQRGWAYTSHAEAEEAAP